MQFKWAKSSDSERICQIIRVSFQKQAEELGITPEKYPNFVAFETAERVQSRMNQGDKAIMLFLKDKPIGTISYSVDKESWKGTIKRLAVIPEYRGNGYGQLLTNYAEGALKEHPVTCIELSIVAQFKGLKEYYQSLGYAVRESKRFATLPFEVLFMEKKIKGEMSGNTKFL
ncbi:GNAT family N-acetyltransferase [Desulforamulus ruminis]